MVDAIILAATSKDRKLIDLDNKALMNIKGKPMIEYVIHALKGASSVDKIIIVGPKEQFEILDIKVDYLVDSKGSMMENVHAGAKYSDGKKRLLICSCDIPMITGEALEDFIEKASEVNSDVVCPIVRKDSIIKNYPKMKRTYFKVREGRFTTGNVFYIKPDIIQRAALKANEFFKFRKNPFKLASMLGIKFISGLFWGHISIKEVEDKLYSISRITAKAVISDYAEIGCDVDKLSDLEIVCKILNC